jgi:hypothetical protein
MHGRLFIAVKGLVERSMVLIVTMAGYHLIRRVNNAKPRSS